MIYIRDSLLVGMEDFLCKQGSKPHAKDGMHQPGKGFLLTTC